MNYSIIGNGNMARFLLQRLQDSDWNCLGLWGRNQQAAARLAGQYSVPLIAQLNIIPDQEGHICFLAVSDSAIETLAQHFAFKHTLLVHHSGISTLYILEPYAQHCAVLWPIYSISPDIDHLQDIPFVFQPGNTHTTRLMENLNKVISNHIILTDEAQRQYLHLNAVLCNNFTQHLLVISQKICAEQGLRYDTLLPIIQQTFQRAASENLAQSQSGPAIRNDQNTIKKHIELLSQHPDWQIVYESLSLSIRKMYTRDEE